MGIIQRTIFFLLIGLYCSPAIVYPVSKPLKKVLVLNSYHPGFPTSSRITEGIRSVFEPAGIAFHIEFMDTKRLLDETHLENIYRLLSYKLSKRDPYDLVITSDDNAFDFMMNHQNDLFKGIPCVFCGLNTPSKATDAACRLSVTGVVETVSMAETVRIALKFRPNTSDIIAIVDETPSGQGDLKTFYRVSEQFEHIRFSELSLARLSFAELARRLGSLPRHSAVILLSAYRDKNGVLLSFDEVTKFLADNCPVPVYHLWEHGLGRGLIGGKVVSHYAQGRVAARLALRILSGQRPEDIPVITQSPNRYIFDYVQLERFHIPLSRLPEEAVVINRPSAFYSDHKNLIRGIIAVFSGLSMIIFFLAINIFRRRRAEERLKQSEEKFRSLSENSCDHIMRYDRNLRHIYMNRAAIKTTGLSVENIIGKTYREMGFPEDLCERWEENIRKVFDTGKVRQTQFRFEGTKREMVLDWLGVPEFSEAGKVVSVLGVSRDITALKQTEEALRESESRYRRIYENIQDVYFETTLDGIITEVSPSVESASGYKWQELIGRSVYSLYPAPDERYRLFKHVLRNGRICDYEITLTGKDGIQIPWSVTLIIIRDRAGKPVRFSGSMRDILERKQAEEQKKRLEKQLRQARKMEALGTLAGGIAHDFNNILFPIIGYTEILLEDASSESTVRHLREIFIAANRARDLIRQILAFSRQKNRELKPLKIRPIIKEALRLMRPTIPATIDVRHGLDDTPWLIMGDPTRIHQIIVNLCTNACHAMEESGGILEVSLKEVEIEDETPAVLMDEMSRKYLCLTVSDSGPGMRREVLERIFDPYYTTKAYGKGTGLGLSVVHGIVKEHRGYIEVCSEPGNGSVFQVFFPLIPSEPLPTAELQAEADLPGGREHILLIDDEEQIVRMEKQMLEKLGYRTSVFTDSEAALTAFEKHPRRYDLVLLDMTLADMTGDILAAKLLAIRPDIPVILCTGFSERISGESAAAIGVSQILVKPIARRDLARGIRQALDT